jgi:Uri superfamily endonuclease
MMAARTMPESDPPPDDLPASPGAYALVFALSGSLRLPVGALGLCELPAGVYIYVGSACGPGGLRARVRRHFRPEKPLHWHVDYLTAAIPPVEVIWEASGARRECEWVRAFVAETGAVAPVPGFGSSDCKAGCPAHLLRLGPVDGTQLRSERGSHGGIVRSPWEGLRLAHSCAPPSAPG